jgi:hypothetical protein
MTDNVAFMQQIKAGGMTALCQQDEWEMSVISKL